MSFKIVLGVTASIAAFKACEIVGLLKKEGYGVRCVMSRDARWFVTPLSLETLSSEKVVFDMFALPETRIPAHISLAEEADLILVAPATADVIGKVASGICDDILTCTICSSAAPVVFAPAMNDRMYLNPVIQDKIKYLCEKGYRFIEPVEGHLACGREGVGHLAPPENILAEVRRILSLKK